MGILDSLLGLKTTDSQTAATRQATAYQQAAADSIESNYAGLQVDAQGNINTGAANASNAVNAGTASAIGALTGQGATAQQQLAGGVNNAVGTLQGSNAQYAPYVANGQAANGLYADSLGLNGAGGNAAAQSAFQASPGYEWNVDQATDAASRKAASLGMAASGNTLAGITQLGSNLANQEYGNWQSNLSGLGNTGLTAANAVSGNNAAAAADQYNGGAAGATLSQALGSSLGNAYTNQGTQLGTIDTGQGTALANLNTGLGTSLAQNRQWGVSGVNSANLALGQAQDSATNANNGIISNLIGGVGNTLLGTATGKSLTSGLMKL